MFSGNLEDNKNLFLPTFNIGHLRGRIYWVYVVIALSNGCYYSIFQWMARYTYFHQIRFKFYQRFQAQRFLGRTVNKDVSQKYPQFFYAEKQTQSYDNDAC